MKIDHYTKLETNYRSRSVIVLATAFVGTQEVEFTQNLKRPDKPLEMTGKDFIEALRYVHEIPDAIHIRLNSVTFYES